MLKEFAWQVFEFTGNIDMYVFFKEMEERQKVSKEAVRAICEAAISLKL